jgi:hypothetical protein
VHMDVDGLWIHESVLSSVRQQGGQAPR